MADSADPPQIVSGGSAESAIVVRSAELSASLKAFLSVSLKPLVALPFLSLKNFLTRRAADAVAHHTTYYKFAGGPSAEKKQKHSIPGLNDSEPEIEGDAPLDVVMAPCQYPEMLTPYRHVEGRYTTFLIAFAANAHATGRDLSFYKPHKLVNDYREAWDRCIYYYDDEEERLWQWRNFLMQLEKGAADDSPESRKHVGDTTPLLIPPYNGANSRKLKPTADVRCVHHTAHSTAAPMNIEHIMTRLALTARCALDGVTMTRVDSMLTDVLRYQTLWTDEHWSVAVRETYILESVLPDDFVLSTYYAKSREMLRLTSNRKNQAKQKTIPAGSPGEGYRIKRVLEPPVNISTLNKTQLIAEVLKRDEEITSMHQEINNYTQLKACNKNYALDIAAAEEKAAEFSATLNSLHDMISDKEGELERSELLAADQAKLITDCQNTLTEMTEAGLREQQSLTAAKALNQQQDTTITDMQVVEHQLRSQVLQLSRQSEKDSEGLADCWKKISVNGGAAQNYEKLWRKSTQSRKQEQEVQAQLQLDLDEALEDINRLKSEAHDTSIDDMYAGATPITQLQTGHASPGLLLSDIKAAGSKSDAPPSSATAAAAAPPPPSFSAVAAASAPPATSAEQPAASAPPGTEIKEELLAQYKAIGQTVMTDYSYKGERLDVSDLITTMQDIYTAFRNEINEWNSKQKPDLDLHQFTQALQLMDIVGREHMRIYVSYYGTHGGAGRCGRCGDTPGSLAGKHGVKGQGLQLDCPDKHVTCDFCKLVFGQVPDINVKMMAPDNVTELHPTGYHKKEVCPYMKARFQYYLVSIIERITGLRPTPKAYVPFGGHGSANQNTSSGLQQVANVSAVDKFASSLGEF